MESLPLQPFLQSLHKEQWQEVRLGEVAEIISGGTPKTSIPEYWNGEIPWLTPKDLAGYNHIYISKGERFITKLGLKNSSATLMPKGTILLSSRAPIGYVAIAQNDICTNQGFKSLIVNPKQACNLFVYYWIKDNVKYLQSLGTGTTFEEISKGVVQDITIPLPPLTIQQKIAEILSSFDDKIDLLHRQNKTLESLALTLFRHYFIDNPNRSEWEEVSLNSLCEITSSKRIFYSEYVEYGIPFYRSKEIIEFSKGNNPQNELFIDENKYNDIANKFGVPQANDILLTSVGTLGIPYLVPKDKKFYFKDGNLTWFKNFKNITSLFLFYWFKSPQGKEKLDSIAIGSTQQALTIAALKAVNIHLPHTDIIRILNEQLNGIQNKIENNTKQIQNLQAMRDMLLKAIFA
ncbi:restriction endonuclease subunit S [Helicobacter winghamensis]|uniref:restriction endonuclease subunit S n=1 Tax=Helicobacter winghamensis TaxID=157268 RepID=UPI0027A82F19